MSKPYADLSWLDEPLVTQSGHFRAAIKPVLKMFPVRAQRVILKAARGELAGRPRLAPVSTFREFIALPTRTLFVQRNYGPKTHAELWRALCGYGVTDAYAST